MQPVADATGARIRQARTAAGHSQQTLATAAGISTKTLSRVEAGEDTTLGTLTALASALGVPVTDLIAAEASA